MSDGHGMSLSVNAHVGPDTVIESTVYATEDRATVSLEAGPGYLAEVTLFAHRAELVRLRDALGAVVDELDGQQAALGASPHVETSAA